MVSFSWDRRPPVPQHPWLHFQPLAHRDRRGRLSHGFAIPLSLYLPFAQAPGELTRRRDFSPRL